MTTLIWLYQFIGSVFLGYLISSAMEPAVVSRKSDWLIIVLLAATWPYAIWLIYRAEMKK